MSAVSPATRESCLAFRPAHDALVCVDSDGCVFDTMEAKQRRCFHPLIIEHWGLHAVADAVGETARFVNLYSRYRGGNRFPNLYLVFRLLADHPQVRGAGVALPDLSALRRLLDTDPAPSQDSLERAARATGDPSLVAVLAWSRAVNRRIAETMSEAPPFRHAVPALERLAATTDLVVVSQTPIEALTREWAASGLDRFVAWIGGQELGTKTEQIALAAHGRYAPGRVLMIGDAIGDLAAARANAAAFYPIRPGEEDASWQHFNAEAFDRFIAGRFAGPYEQALTAAFEAGLPERPPWRP